MRQDETIANLAKAVGGAVDEFRRMVSVVCKMQWAQKVPSLMVVSRMSIVDSVMVSLVMWFIPKGIDRARGRWTTL